ALPFASVRYATFEVQTARRVLVVADDVRNARVLKTALESGKAFQCDVKSTEEMKNVFPPDLAPYKTVVLLGLARPDADLWEKLSKRYVREGGGLAIVPSGKSEEDAYNSPSAQALMPATLEKVVDAGTEQGAVWSAATYKHPLMAPFGEWAQGEPVDFLA